jgi:asparagine synthase (glutamine-hydrolysing)
MCGFAAVIRKAADEPADSRLASHMADAMPHRGPDDAGGYSRANVAFGFRRLSILDLSDAAHQPLVGADGAVAIVFNGAIYNYAELRTELQLLGHSFHSTGDTEVLLHAYLQWGEECLARLNGMWAFLIHDSRQGTVFGARDRFGVKPLFYAEDGDTFLFASEIKALHRAMPVTLEIDVQRIAALAATGRLEKIAAGATTFFKNVHQIGRALLHGDAARQAAGATILDSAT